MSMPRVADLHAGEWQEHARFPGIYMKGLLNSADNPLASVNVVQVPLNGNIGRHRHAQQLEMVWIVKGQVVLTIDQTDISSKTDKSSRSLLGLNMLYAMQDIPSLSC